MLKNNRLPGNRWHPLIFYTVAALILIADQISKACIRSLLYPGQSIPEDGFFHLTHVQNTGAAFGMLHGQFLFLTIFAIIGVVIILCYALYYHKRFPLLASWYGSVVMGMVLAGCAGNLIDRLRQGYVTDFIGVGPWPLFNVADSSLSVGIVLFACILLMAARAEKNR